jgi:glycosyltransferase involved in cell wall biosynthesis
MRIAMLSSISWRTPPHGYGPWELVTSLLTEALVAHGVEVTLFATLDSETAGTLDGVVARGYSEDPTIDAKVAELRHIAHLFERAGDFDIIHNQADFVPLAFSRLVETPIVTTIHGFSSDRILPAYRDYDDRVGYVAISDADRHPDLRYAATIHHGIRLDDFAFDPAGGDDLLFFGRIHPDKGAGEAVRAARASGHRLVMAGLVQDQGYHEREVAPFIDGDRVRHLGVVGGPRRAEVLGRAKALLHLIGFDEPFGLSVVEALACGTPVIAYNRGSMPELIDHGVTGFLVDSFDEAVAAIARIDEIDRAACRRAAEERFGVDRMAGRYLALYEEMLARPYRQSKRNETRKMVSAISPPIWTDMTASKTTIERAFELAREGRCHSIDDIRRALTHENYDNVQAHLAGPAIARQMRLLIDGARARDQRTATIPDEA